MSARVALGRRAMSLRARLGVCTALGLGLVVQTAWGDRALSREGAPLFSISKSENKNQVAFAVRLDAECRPVGDAPVYAYWRMLERSPAAVEPLLPVEQGAYGIGRQRVERGESGGAVRIALRALPDREILVRTVRQASACAAVASTRIADTPAHLFNVHARIAWPFGVDSLLITGWAESDGHVVRETMRP
jgi:uncharacterized protein DUF4833